MEKELKYPNEFQIGDVVFADSAYTQTLLELVDVERKKWCSGETLVFKICNNFSDVVYIHRYHSQRPHIIIGNVGEEEVTNILQTLPFKEYQATVKG